MLEGWAGELYGIPVDSTMEAIRLGAQLEAMITDPVYEGKSLAGLIDLVRSGRIPRELHRALRPPRRSAGVERLPLAVALTTEPRVIPEASTWLFSSARGSRKCDATPGYRDSQCPSGARPPLVALRRCADRGRRLCARTDHRHKVISIDDV